MIPIEETLANKADSETIQELEVFEVDEANGIDCPEEALRIFVPLVLDSLQYPFVRSLPRSHQDNWLRIIAHLVAVAESLETVSDRHH